MKTIDAQVRRMLAAELRMQESSLVDDFRWLDAIGVEDSSYFLARINNAFAEIPKGFSFGTGKLPFHRADAELLERIATVGGLMSYVRKYLSEI
jgi:hypothetical protein